MMFELRGWSVEAMLTNPLLFFLFKFFSFLFYSVKWGGKPLQKSCSREYNHIFMISSPQTVTVAGPAGTSLPRPSLASSDRSRAEHAIELQADCDCPQQVERMP